MEKLDKFKKFISIHPEFVDYVKTNKTSWQTFYELYDLYGENMDVWNKYIKSNNETVNIKGLLNTIKNINLDSLEENISSIQKAVSLVEELTKPTIEEKKEVKEEKINKIYEDNE